jgi:hypothetical protein
MSIYHFDIADSSPPNPCEGIDLPSLDAARGIALQFAGAVLADKPSSFWTEEDWVMTVGDAQRRPLFSISVSTRDCGAAL